MLYCCATTVAVSHTLTFHNEPHVQFTQIEIYCVFDSKVLQVQVSPLLHSLVAWLPTTRPTIHSLPDFFRNCELQNLLEHVLAPASAHRATQAVFLFVEIGGPEKEPDNSMRRVRSRPTKTLD